MVIMSGADERSGWVEFEGGPFDEYNERRCEEKLTWTDGELWLAQNIISRAFAAEASNAATVVLPYDIFDSKSHWNGELETLKANPDVHKVVAFDMKDCNVDIDGEPRELWSRGEPTTEHAG